MSRCPEVDIHLPAGMRASEDSEHLIVHCLWCKDEAVYRGGYVSLRTLVADAKAHAASCPRRKGVLTNSEALSE